MSEVNSKSDAAAIGAGIGCCTICLPSCGIGLLAGTATIIGGIALFILGQNIQSPNVQFWTRFTSISALVTGVCFVVMPFVSCFTGMPSGGLCGWVIKKISSKKSEYNVYKS